MVVVVSGETTNVVATCGGDTVSLIDCSTGRLMKRYQQSKEVGYLCDVSTSCGGSTNDRHMIGLCEAVVINLQF